MTERNFHPPVWDRGEPIDEGMLAFTIGEDWRMDQRLVAHDITGSLAHAAGLLKAELIDETAHANISAGLEGLLAYWTAGEWTVGPEDEDVHSAVERRLIEAIGEDGKRLHTGRSRNDQVAVDMRLWLRDAVAETRAQLGGIAAAFTKLAERAGALPLPGYTHLQRAMPSLVSDWAGAHAAAFAADTAELSACEARISKCPLGSGSGYGIPLPLERAFVAERLGFDAPEEPVTLTQHSRGRAELAYLTALEAVALDLGKLCADLWLFSTSEFGFLKLPVAFTTGSSLMPQKRNPDLIELMRGRARGMIADRAALMETLKDLPSGYHRDFQLVKPPLFRAYDTAAELLPLLARVLDAVSFDEAALAEAVSDPALQATAEALERAADGETFRDAYRSVSQSAATDA